jgi:hypothetical protein
MSIKGNMTNVKEQIAEQNCRICGTKNIGTIE